MLDAPRPAISGEALRVREMARKAANTKAPLTPTAVLPQERATDSDEARRLKRAILAKDAELREALQKMQHLAQQLERLVDRFSSSVVADEYQPPSTPDKGPVSAFSQDANSSTDSVINQRNARRTAAASSQPTSLEAILAAARGGGGGASNKGSPAASGDRPKYAKLLRDLK